MAVVEADIEAGAGGCRNNIMRRVASIDAGDLEIGWLEMLAAFIEGLRLQERKRLDERWQRIFRFLRISRMALNTSHPKLGAERTSAANLDGIPYKDLGSAFAEDAAVGLLCSSTKPVNDLFCAVNRRAFLIGGDKKADRSAEIGGLCPQIFENGGKRGRN